MAAFIQSMVKKYPHLDSEKIKAQVQRNSEYLEEPVKLSFNFGGDSGFRGILKIALQFRLVREGAPANLDGLLDILEAKSKPQSNVFFSQGFDPFGLDKDQTVTHSISLVGSRASGLVYVHVTLFSFLRLFVILEESYAGSDFSHAYMQDAITGAELAVPKHDQLSSTEVAGRRADPHWPPRDFVSEMNRVTGVGVARMKLNHIKNLFSESLTVWGEKHEGELITEEMAIELTSAFRSALEKALR